MLKIVKTPRTQKEHRTPFSPAERAALDEIFREDKQMLDALSKM